MLRLNLSHVVDLQPSKQDPSSEEDRAANGAGDVRERRAHSLNLRKKGGWVSFPTENPPS
jgi:hypothetical protein